MNDDDRSVHAKAYGLASRLTAICVGMVLPAVGGYWVDGRLGTGYIFLIVGLAFGMATGIWQLIRLVQSLDNGSRDP